MGILTSDRVRSRAGALVGSCLCLFVLLLAAPAAAQCPTALLTAPDAIPPSDWNFGRSVAVDGDRLLVGAPSASGADFQTGAGYFHRYVNGEWVFEQKIFWPSGQYEDGLGKSADFSGDVAVLGSNLPLLTGLIAFFRRDPSGSWYAEAQFGPLGIHPLWVAIDGDLAVTKTPLVPPYFGGIVVYRSIGAGIWVEESLPIPPLVEGMNFGIAGDVDDGIIAIGAPQTGPASPGQVFLFSDQPGGWQVDVIDGPPGSHFGVDLSLSDGRLVVATYLQGVHVYDYDGTYWLPAGTIEVIGGGITLEVAVSGDEILVGDQNRDGSAEYCGVVDRYTLTGGDWIRTASFESTMPSYGGTFGGGNFGRVIALDGPIAAIGSDVYSGFAEIFRIDDGDCNGNGVCDELDLASGTSVDADGDGVPDECRPFRRGDVDQSGSPTIADAIGALGYLFQSQQLACIRAADWNDDDSVNILDPVLGLLLLFGTPGATPIPPPYPDCGPDPTRGDLTCDSFGGC